MLFTCKLHCCRYVLAFWPDASWLEFQSHYGRWSRGGMA